MLVASLVRRTLALEPRRVAKVVEEDGWLVVDLEKVRRRRLECAGCVVRCPGYDRLAERSWRHVPLPGIPVQLRYRPWRVDCAACGVNVESIPWSARASLRSRCR